MVVLAQRTVLVRWTVFSDRLVYVRVVQQRLGRRGFGLRVWQQMTDFFTPSPPRLPSATARLQSTQTWCHQLALQSNNPRMQLAQSLRCCAWRGKHTSNQRHGTFLLHDATISPNRDGPKPGHYDSHGKSIASPMPIDTTTACCCDGIVSKFCLATVASVLPQCAFSLGHLLLGARCLRSCLVVESVAVECLSEL